MHFKNAFAITFLVALSACASKPRTSDPTETPSAAPSAKAVKSADSSSKGEILGTINPNSKFAKLKIGMSMAKVHELIKTPDDMKRHETGKRWIPFYFGNDVQRIQVYYAGEGCLSYTGGNVFGGGDGELVKIEADMTKACFE